MGVSPVRVRVPPSAHNQIKESVLKVTHFILSAVLAAYGFGASYDEAKSSYDAGDCPQAQALILQIIESAEEADAGHHLLAADIAICLDDLKSAHGHITTAIEIDPQNEEYRTYWDQLNEMNSLMGEARRSLDNGYYDEAVATYDSTITKFPEFALAYYQRGMVFYLQEQFNSAVDNFQVAVEKNPFEEKYSKAIDNIVRKLVNSGNDHMRRKDYDLAITSYRDALRYSPGFIEAVFRLSYALFKLDDFESAKIELTAGLAQNPDHYNSWKLLGDVEGSMAKNVTDDAQMAEHLHQAEAAYLKAIEFNSNYDKAYYALGKIYIDLNETGNALDQLQLAVQVNPAYPEAWELRGVLLQQSERYDEAIECYQQAVQNATKRFNIYLPLYRQAEVFNLLKNYKSAQEAAKASLEDNDDFAGAWFELGLCEKCLGNKPAALNAFEKSKTDKKWRKQSEFQIKYIDKPCED